MSYIPEELHVYEGAVVEAVKVASPLRTEVGTYVSEFVSPVEYAVEPRHIASPLLRGTVHIEA